MSDPSEPDPADAALRAELHRAAGSTSSDYSAADVGRTARVRRARRRAAAGAVLAVIAVAGLGLALDTDEQSTPLDVVDEAPTPDAPTTAPPPATTDTAPEVAPSAVNPACITVDKVVDDQVLLGEVDIDGDGLPDRIMANQSAQWAELSDGSTTPTTEIHPSNRRFSVLDTADLDGDGRKELFLDIGGNTALWAVVADFDPTTCTLRTILSTDEVELELLYFGTGNSCLPTCGVTVTCRATADGVVVEPFTAFPDPEAFDLTEYMQGGAVQPPPDLLMKWSFERYVIDDGRAKLLESDSGTTPLSELREMRAGMRCGETLAVTPAAICTGLMADTTRSEGIRADFDGDGIEDPLWTVPDAEEQWPWLQVERSSDGTFSEPLHLRFTTYSAGGGLLDAADIDGDGRQEGFITLGGNTAAGGTIIELEGCLLREVLEPTTSETGGSERFQYLHWATGNSCGPSGCAISVVCRSAGAATEVVLTQVTPLVSSVDPEFDPSAIEGVPREQLEVNLRQQVYIVIDGAATLSDTTESTMTLGEAGIWGRRSGVDCSVPLAGGVACSGVIPFVVESVAGWTTERFESAIPRATEVTTILRWTREVDGAVVDLQNPGRVMVGDGDMGDVTIAGSRGRVAAIGSNSRVGPIMIIWNENDEARGEACGRWTFVSDELGPIELTEFVAESVGAGPVDWFYAEPAQYLIDDEVLALGERFLDELLAWGPGSSTPPSALPLNGAIERYLQATRLEAIQPDDFYTDAAWRYEFEPGGPFGFVPEWMQRIESWDVVLGPHPVCAATARDSPAWPPTVHQFSFVPAEGATSSCAEDWFSVDFFLYGDGTVHTVRVDSFEP